MYFWAKNGQNGQNKNFLRHNTDIWWFKSIVPTSWPSFRQIWCALHIAIKFVMNNHTYTFGNQIRKQSKGGPIGLDLTGAIAQIYMIWWAEEL